jgi:hypothetical protein
MVVKLQLSAKAKERLKVLENNMLRRLSDHTRGEIT